MEEKKDNKKNKQKNVLHECGFSKLKASQAKKGRPLEPRNQLCSLKKAKKHI